MSSSRGGDGRGSPAVAGMQGDGSWRQRRGFARWVLCDQFATEGAGEDALFEAVEEGEGSGGLPALRFDLRRSLLKLCNSRDLHLGGRKWKANRRQCLARQLLDGRTREVLSELDAVGHVTWAEREPVGLHTFFRTKPVQCLPKFDVSLAIASNCDPTRPPHSQTSTSRSRIENLVASSPVKRMVSRSDRSKANHRTLMLRR